MKLGAFLLNEKTKVSLNIINFVILVGFVVTASFTFASWKTDMENRIDKNTVSIDAEINSRIESEARIIQDVESNAVVMLEIQSGQSDIKTSMARVETNILWIMNTLKRNSE